MGALSVAIDGPVAAGKSTIGRLLANRLNAVFFDTGILYRAITHTVLERGIDPDDKESVERVAATMDASLDEINGATRLLVSGRDITDELRTPEIDRALPAISANPGVRRHLLGKQREIVSGRRAVVVGRDIGTVILPDADLKVFLDADPKIRADRRHAELRERGVDISWETVYRDLLARDERDTGRAVAPLVVPEGAVVVDASNRTISELVDMISQMAEERGDECRG